jgi:hypothetical protein
MPGPLLLVYFMAHIFPPAEKADPSREYIIRSQTHERGKIGTEAPIFLSNVPGVPAIVGFPSVVGVPSVVGFPSVVGLLSVVGVPSVVGIPAVVGVPSVAGVPTLVNIPSVNVVSTDYCIPVVGDPRCRIQRKTRCTGPYAGVDYI